MLMRIQQGQCIPAGITDVGWQAVMKWAGSNKVGLLYSDCKSGWLLLGAAASVNKQVESANICLMTPCPTAVNSSRPGQAAFIASRCVSGSLYLPAWGCQGQLLGLQLGSRGGCTTSWQRGQAAHASSLPGSLAKDSSLLRYPQPTP